MPRVQRGVQARQRRQPGAVAHRRRKCRCGGGGGARRRQMRLAGRQRLAGGRGREPEGIPVVILDARGRRGVSARRMRTAGACIAKQQVRTAVSGACMRGVAALRGLQIVELRPWQPSPAHTAWRSGRRRVPGATSEQRLSSGKRPAGGQLGAGAGQTRCWFATMPECAAAARACVAFGRVPQRVVTLGPTSGCQGCCACSMDAGTTVRGVRPPRRGRLCCGSENLVLARCTSAPAGYPRIDGPAHRDRL